MPLPEEVKSVGFLICGMGCFLCGFFALGSGKGIFAAIGVLFILLLMTVLFLF